MLKKISLSLVFLLFLGCSNLSSNERSLPLEEQSLIKKIDEGKISEATELLSKIDFTSKPKKLEDYQTMISKRDQEIKDLEKVINILKDAFSKNHFFIIEQYTNMSIKNKIKLNELKKLDFSHGNIYTAKPVFIKDKASVLTVVNFYDESLYLDIFFSLKNNKWEITDFNERR